MGSDPRSADALPSEPKITGARTSRSSPLRSSRSRARPPAYPTSRCWNSMRTRPVRSASVIKSSFSSPRDMELMNSVSSRPYRRKRGPLPAACTMRPYIGIAWRSTSPSSPTWCSAYSPRVETARLIERPAPIRTRRMSGRRSNTRTSWPRRARNRARSDPTGPAPITVSGSATPQLLAEQLGHALHVGEARVERRRGEAQHVGRARVAGDAAGAQGREERGRIAGYAQAQHGPAPGRVPRREHVSHAAKQPFEIAGEPHALLAERGDPCLVEQLEGSSQRGQLEDGRIRDLPAFRAGNGKKNPRHGEARLLVVSPPTREPRKHRAGMALVHERAAGAARAGIEVLVAAPDGEVGVRIVQPEDQVPHPVGEIEAGDAPSLVRRLDERGEVERLAGEEVRRPEQEERDGAVQVPPRIVAARDLDDRARKSVERGVGSDGVTVRGKGVLLDQDAVPGRRRPVERDHQQVQVHG